ncbi:MAG: cadmium-translocating P-type ATPase [Chloroflexi bacterium]|nr:cadmium-translocating P-type ATPase [Chloroflexota bacterium]
MDNAASTLGPAAELRSETLELQGLDCPDCAAGLEKAIAGMPGVANARLSYTSSTLWVEYVPQLMGRDRIVAGVHEAGYRVREQTPEGREEGRSALAFWRRHPRGVATALSGGLVAVGLLLTLLSVPSPLPQLAFGLGVVVGGYHTARSALFSLRSGLTDMNVLMTAAVVGALAIGEWTEAASVVFLFSLANALESYTMDRTRRSIRSLLQLAPREATLLKDGRQLKLPVEQIAAGDLLLVRPGERIATDGVVVGGSSTVDQAPITGESVPVEKGMGDELYAGTINQQGALEVRATRPYRENTLSRIIQMVEEAQSQKAPAQQFVDRFARYYTPAVILLATGIALVPSIFFGAAFAVWFYRALVLLIIACPCALVISTPVSIASAIATASRNGVLFKGGSYLEAVGSIPVVAFDKTGTLTRGRPEVTDVVSLNGYDRRELLAVAAALEARSEHPLAQAILHRAAEEGVQVPQVGEFQAVPGLGAVGQVGGTSYFVGSARLAQERLGSSLQLPDALEGLQEEGKTVMLLGRDGQLLGMVAAADRLRAESRRAVAQLHRDGVRQVVLLTGDNPRTAAAIASQVGADGFQADLLPEDKKGAVEALLDRYGRVAMVGDGVNDAPALARATVGIAMGAAGTDTALETADVALMGDDLSKLPYVIRLSRRTVRTIQQNVALSIAVKLVFVMLASLGMANLWMAVLADMGTSLVVIGNGMRLLEKR